jgi:tripartite-type tricarboxylate transporter receptor subunit TctC
VPTFAEVGLREVKIDVWFGLASPAGLPAGIVRTINSAVNDALSEGELRNQLLKLGSDVRADTPEHFAEFWESEVKRYADVVRLSGATPE